MFLSACSYITPHKIEVQQGNLVTQESFARVKVGMNKNQVRAVLGTPLLQDVFHANRWDYFFSHDKPGSFAPFMRDREQRKLTLMFENDKLAKIEGDVNSLPPDKPLEKK
jgi:outer membrane protein assembly factor BamE